MNNLEIVKENRKIVSLYNITRYTCTTAQAHKNTQMDSRLMSMWVYKRVHMYLFKIIPKYVALTKYKTLCISIIYNNYICIIYEG